MTVAVQTRPRVGLSARERLELVLGHIDHLPTIPAVAGRLLAVSSSDDSCARDVVELIESDASLTAAILRMVRRADLGAPTHGLTVERAVKFLGLNRVRNLALSVQVFETLSNPEEDDRARKARNGIWLHSLAVACAAEAIAERMGGADLAGEAFVCGLLHDIGKVALDLCLPKSYARVVETVERSRDCICDVERRVLGLDHTLAGKRLAQRWQLPEAVVEAVWLHHQDPSTLPSTVVHRELVGIVHLADHLVRREGIGYSGYQHVADVEILMNQLGLESAAFSAVLKKLPERMEPLQELLGLADPPNAERHAASVIEANRKLASLNAALIEENERLDLRSRCLAALECFTKSLGDQDDIASVCNAAAQSLCTLFQGDAAVVFCKEGQTQNVYLGCAPAAKTGESIAALDFGEPDAAAAWERALMRASAALITPAPDGFEAIWSHGPATPASHPVWLLSLSGGEATAGALISAPKDAARPFCKATNECSSLADVIGLALKSARVRTRSNRMNEELLDLNRQLGVAQKQLVQIRSMSMVGAMAGGAAHELNNPLAVISARAQIELARCEDQNLARAFQIIIDQTQQATDIVTDLMRFAKPQPPTPVLLPLSGMLEAACQHWRTTYSLDAEQLTVHLLDDQVGVYADGGQLQEILNAVVDNAVAAMDKETGRLQVNSPSRATDETVRIVVEDNGAGMTSDVVEHAFDPFFSDRPAGRGRGLGLSRAYRLVENQGGRLWLKSTPDVGTIVTIELPAHAPNA